MTRISWRSVDPASNRYRWYSLETSRDLWGQACIICRWGRLGRQGGRRIEWYTSHEHRQKIISNIKRTRSQHGYNTLAK